ncbi:MAG: hypothetical protein JW904_03335 [Spirochaetales bacterium]|nr:hypothetical protein [Spirochaetales bacterium]
MDLIIRLLSDWHLALVFLVLIILFPVIFYLSSLDKSAVKVKKVPLVKKSKKKSARMPQRPVTRSEDHEE